MEKLPRRAGSWKYALSVAWTAVKNPVSGGLLGLLGAVGTVQTVSGFLPPGNSFRLLVETAPGRLPMSWLVVAALLVVTVSVVRWAAAKTGGLEDQLEDIGSARSDIARALSKLDEFEGGGRGAFLRCREKDKTGAFDQRLALDAVFDGPERAAGRFEWEKAERFCAVLLKAELAHRSKIETWPSPKRTAISLEWTLPLAREVEDHLRELAAGSEGASPPLP